MKLRLTIDLDVPGIEDASLHEIRQIIFDEYVHYVTVNHLKDVLGAMTDGTMESIKHHRDWSQITLDPVWTVEALT